MRRRLPIFFLIIIYLSACTLPAVRTNSTPDTPVSATANPSLEPTQTVTITPNPSPTPQPAVRVIAGEKSILNGNYSQARQDFQSALLSNTSEDLLAAALWGIGKTDFLDRNFPAALESLRELIQKYPDSKESTLAWFLLGETYYSLERYQESIDAYQKYLSAKPGLLDAYIKEKQGDAFVLIGDYLNAQVTYKEAEIAPGQGNPEAIRIKLANSYLAFGSANEALQIFDDIYSTTTNDYLKAQMDLLSGRALIALGKVEDGYGRWRHAVDNYPMSYDSYSALVGLVESQQEVDEFNRGLVDYFAQKYDVALSAFQRFISQNPNHDGTVLHYMALTLREMGDYNSAIQLWDTLIDKYPGNRFWDSAWDEKATTQWVYLDDYINAAQGLETFTTVTVGSPYTVTYLLEAARIYERAGELERAAILWETLPERFGQDIAMGNSWFQAGIVRYRLQEYSKAIEDFQQALLLAKEPPDRARALLWIGKSYAILNELPNAYSTWEQAQAVDPDGYYGIRSRDLRENREPFAAPPVLNLNFDISAERLEAASWVRIKFDLPANTDLSILGDIHSNPRIIRGDEFWNLGLYDEARLEYEAVREEVKNNPEDSFRLGNYFLDIGLYRSGIYALREVLTLAGLDDHSASLSAPVYFTHIRYGLYFSDIVWQAASETGLDPLFVMSVIRQESLFEGFVRSSQGARGLMQILPSTGESIASIMGWPTDFEPDDLYSPYISIRLGTQYLLSNRRYMDGDLYGTLAAYNGGPGNANIWKELAAGDVDLELEIIRFGETRDYIRSIYEIYTTYRRLYSPMQ